jgi:hypothetical protein
MMPTALFLSRVLRSLRRSQVEAHVIPVQRLPLLLLLGICAASTSAEAADDGGGTAQVLEHHGNAERSGQYIVPGLTWDAAVHLHGDAAFHADIAGPVYAQPLYWRKPGGDHALLVVVSEQNIVYALDSRSGALAWKTSVGPPVKLSSQPCGNVDPLGLTGTPVIDGHREAVYLGAMVADKAGARHMVVALSLKDGSVLPGWPLDVQAALQHLGQSFTSAVQNQRGALTILGDTVYIPYGGHFGDCGDYRGMVVSVGLEPPHAVHSWSTTARGGGIWAPGGVSSDGKSVYVATGNTMLALHWSGGEAVIRLAPDLKFSAQPRDFFAPSNWLRLDVTDADLGGTNPLLVKLPARQFMLALGKDGKAYLLDAQNLGGIGGELLSRKVSNDAIRTSPAYIALDNKAWVAFLGQGVDCPNRSNGELTALKITPGASPTLDVAWCASAHGHGSPIITTTDGRANPIVWIVGAEGSNRLQGFRADTGAAVFAGGGVAEAMTKVRRFQAPIAAGGRLYVAADEHVYAFTW